MSQDLAGDPVIRFVTSKAEELIPHSTVRLFGSRARGDHTPTSDYDFAVDVASGDQSGLVWFEDQMQNELPTIHKVDIVDLHKCQAELRNRILQEGVLIYDGRSKSKKA